MKVYSAWALALTTLVYAGLGNDQAGVVSRQPPQ